jgi:arylformamidase
MFPPPRFSYFAQVPQKPLNVTHMETVVHMGTHVDAPRHFYADGPGMNEIPLERMMGEGVVIRLDRSVNEEISVDDLAAATPTIEHGDIVAIDTGWGARWDTAEWNQHPYLSLEAAQWLVDHKVKLVAVDTATPDLPFDLRTKDFSFPIHCLLLKEGVLISEQIANLHTLTARRVEFFFARFRLKIATVHLPEFWLAASRKPFVFKPFSFRKKYRYGQNDVADLLKGSDQAR